MNLSGMRIDLTRDGPLQRYLRDPDYVKKHGKTRILHCTFNADSAPTEEQCEEFMLEIIQQHERGETRTVHPLEIDGYKLLSGVVPPDVAEFELEVDEHQRLWWIPKRMTIHELLASE